MTSLAIAMLQRALPAEHKDAKLGPLARRSNAKAAQRIHFKRRCSRESAADSGHYSERFVPIVAAISAQPDENRPRDMSCEPAVPRRRRETLSRGRCPRNN